MYYFTNYTCMGFNERKIYLFVVVVVIFCTSKMNIVPFYEILGHYMYL